jgi:hypothetical protein
MSLVRGKVTAFGEPGKVPISLAQDLIEASAFWVDHPQGIIHPEPGWSNHIEKGPHGWEVQFGANYFLVEQAILLCKRTILEELDHAQELNHPIDQTLLRRRLVTCVKKSVAAYDHNTFPHYTGGAEPETKRQGYYIGGSRFRSLSNLNRYGSTPPSKDVWKGFMKFGVHAIKIDGFVERIWQLASLETVEKRIVR